jgi:hypothetical protein
MIKLTDLLKEIENNYSNQIIKLSPILNKLVARDSPKIYTGANSTQYSKDGQLSNTNTPFYDFGGADKILQSFNNTVVDYSDTMEMITADEIEEMVKDGEIAKFIDADLSKPIKLSPKSAINMSWSLGWFINEGNASTIAKNINNALSPGGILVITEHLTAILMLLKHLPSFKLLEINYISDDQSGYTLEDIEQMEKDGTLTPDVIEDFLNNTATVVLQK